MVKYFLVVCFLCISISHTLAQPNKNMTTKFTHINLLMYPKLSHLTWDTFLTCKAHYHIDSVDASKSTLTIIISDKKITNADLPDPQLINRCKPNTHVFKIELKNKSGNGFKIGNYNYDGSDTKPLNGLPKIELIEKPSLSLMGKAQSKTYYFDTSKNHTCEVISLDEHFIYGSFYFKDPEGIISGQFKAEIIK